MPLAKVHLLEGQYNSTRIAQLSKAIQDALLSDGQVDPSRVFIVSATPQPDTGDKVKVEMAVK